MSYFRNFPNIEIDINGSPISVKDIIRRVEINNETFTNSSNYNLYRLSDGETLKDVAKKQFGDPNLDWAIILFNSLTDPFYSTPLTTKEFEDFVARKYSGQSLFCSASGSSLPFFLNSGSFDEGDFISEKTLGSNNERVFTDETKSGTIKSYDPSLSKFELRNQVGVFAKDDLVVNRTQFDFSPLETIDNLEKTNTEVSVPVNERTVTMNTPWQPFNSGDVGTLVGWYNPDGLGFTQTNGISGEGVPGLTFDRVNVWSNSAPPNVNISQPASQKDLTCITAGEMPLKSEDAELGVNCVDCDLSNATDVTDSMHRFSSMVFADSTGDYELNREDYLFFFLYRFKKNTNKDLGTFLAYPDHYYVYDQDQPIAVQGVGGIGNSDYRERFINHNSAFMSPPGGKPVPGASISMNYHSLNSLFPDSQTPSTYVPPYVRSSGKFNILGFGRKDGGTGAATPVLRINGTTPSGFAMNSKTISFLNLEKVGITHNISFFGKHNAGNGSTGGILFSTVAGKFYEMIVFKGVTGGSAATDELIEKTEGYLAHKYGLQNELLSALHPYRVNPPLISSDDVGNNGGVGQGQNGEIGVNPGADGDERVFTIAKVVDSPEAARRFVLNPGSSTDFVLNPLASPPDSNNQQTPIGATSSSFDSGLTAVTYGSTILFNYIYNNDTTYVETNKMFEQNLNESKRFIRLPRRELIPDIVQSFQKAIST